MKRLWSVIFILSVTIGLGCTMEVDAEDQGDKQSGDAQAGFTDKELEKLIEEGVKGAMAEWLAEQERRAEEERLAWEKENCPDGDCYGPVRRPKCDDFECCWDDDECWEECDDEDCWDECDEEDCWDECDDEEDCWDECEEGDDCWDECDDDDDCPQPDFEDPRNRGEPLGAVSNAETTIADFEIRSVYATKLDGVAGISILASDQELRSGIFDEIAEFVCEPCDRGDAGYCDDVEVPDFNALSLTFLASATDDPDHLVGADGFPTTTAYNLQPLPADPTDPDYVTIFNENTLQGLTVGAMLGQDFEMGHGSFEFDTAPTAVGDDFTADLNLTFANGDTFTGQISGKIWEFPETPEIPECDEDEWIRPIYAD